MDPKPAQTASTAGTVATQPAASSEATPTPAPADGQVPPPQGDPPPVPAASPKKFKLSFGWLRPLGIILVIFLLGIVFEKYQMMKRLQAVRWPRVSVVIPSPTPTPTPVASTTPAATPAPVATASATPATPSATPTK